MPETEPERVTPSPPPPPVEPERRRSKALPVLGLLGFIVLAIAIVYLWVRPVPPPSMPAMPPDESGAVASLQSTVADLKTQLAALDAREASDVSVLQKVVAAIPPPEPAAQPAASPTTSPAPSPAPDTALAEKVAALSASLDKIQTAEAAQAQQTQALPSAADVSNLASRVDAITQREAKDGDQMRQDLSLVQQQLAGITSQAQTFTKATSDLPALKAKADRLSQIVRAQEALRAGIPLGSIDHAPPALARFAASAPPTDADLRLSFPVAAKAADKAAGPQPDKGRFWQRVLTRVENLVTVQQGDHVIVGDQTAGILAHAQRLLDAGDLAGTLTVLGTLPPGAAKVMAPWEAQAQSVLDARAALATMAAG